MLNLRYPHPRFPNVKATADGRVFSHGKELKGSNITYPQVYVRDDHRLHSKHRIVFECISMEELPPYERKGDGVEINHRDGDTHNARFDNLELATHTENMRHSWRELGNRQALAPGVLNASAKLSKDQVLEVFVGDRAGRTKAEMAREFGVNASALTRVLQGKQYKAEGQWARSQLGQ